MDTETNKSDFLSLIQDETFIKRVTEAEDSYELLQELLDQYPQNRESVRYAFEFIRVNRANKATMDAKDYNRILNKLQHQSKKKSSPRFFSIIPRYMRVAAMILVILSVGSVIVYQKFASDPLTQFAHQTVADDSQAMIVLSDGTSQPLKNNDSFIDYKSTNGEVIVKNMDQEEKIDNSNTHKKAVLNQIVVPYGQRQRVLLSDGTLVQLNAGSKLTFPATFTGKTREVFLKGEGFFEVSKNAQMPFIVKTDQIDIKVLGTSFNVSSYAEDNTVQTVLLIGKVTAGKNKLFTSTIDLIPGERLTYDKNNSNLSKDKVDVQLYSSWVNGYLVFRNMPITEVYTKLERYYNRQISVEDGLEKITFSGKLDLGDNLRNVLTNIAFAASVNVEENNGSYVIKK